MTFFRTSRETVTSPDSTMDPRANSPCLAPFRARASTSSKVRRGLFLTLSLLMVPSPLASQSQDGRMGPARNDGAGDCPNETTALVLSGGGAWGLAHVGVIMALEELGCRPHLIVGSSMGAITGSLVAAGYTGAEIADLAMEFPLEKVFSGYDPRLPAPLDTLPVLFTMRQRPGEKLALQAPFARDDLARKFLGKALSGGNGEGRPDFSSLSVPFYVVTTNIETGEAVTLSRGDLVDAVLASSAIPILFPPVMIDGQPLVDAGLIENIPVRTARDLGAVRVIVSDVTDHLEKGSLNLESLDGMTKALLANLFRQPEPELGDGDVLVRPDFASYPKLGFSKRQKKALIRLGYEAAKETFEEVACLPYAPGGRAGESVSGSREPGNVRDHTLVSTRFPTAPGDDDVFSGSRPEFPSFDGAEEVEPTSRPTLAPRGASEKEGPGHGTSLQQARFLGGGGGYNYERGSVGWIGLVQEGFLGGKATGGMVVVAGTQTKRIELSLRGNGSLARGVWPFFSTSLEHQRIRQFDDSGEETEGFGVKSLSTTFGPEWRSGSWTVRGGVRFEAWRSPETPNTEFTGGAGIRLEQTTRAGSSVRAEAAWMRSYTRLAAQGEWPVRVARGRLTPGIRLGWGHHLPLQRTFPPGGSRGFPGQHFGETRGDHEAMVNLRGCHPIWGPFRLRLEVASAWVGPEGTGLPNDSFLLGARVGVGIDTFAGPFDLGFGWTDSGRQAMYIQIGRLF